MILSLRLNWVASNLYWKVLDRIEGISFDRERLTGFFRLSKKERLKLTLLILIKILLIDRDKGKNPEILSKISIRITPLSCSKLELTFTKRFSPLSAYPKPFQQKCVRQAFGHVLFSAQSKQ